ncbi:MAG: rhomboid family intramembrane serine protease [Planctomycetes bacterium]|nr:rhomboid family intramembrane serine protease [Planctomycetota bacterium]
MVSFLVALICLGIFFYYGLSQESSGVLARLALSEGAWSEFGTKGWRLVTATVTHTDVMLGLVSVILVWLALGDFEMRAGPSAALTLVVVGGAGLNALRTKIEPTATLYQLSGAWVIGIAAALGAAVLAKRRGEPVQRQLSLVALQVLLAAAFIFFAGIWDNALLETSLAAGLLGAAWGALWPSGVRSIKDLGTAPRGERPLRIVTALIGVGALVAAFAQATLLDTGPPELRPIPPLIQRMNPEPLLVELMLPSNWSEVPLPKEVDCGTCGQQAKWDRALINDPIPGPKVCSNCTGEVLHGNRRFAYYAGGAGLMTGPDRGLLVYTQERAAYDDPDTFIELFLEQQFRKDDSEFREAPIEQQEFFQTEAYERGYRLVLRGKKKRATLYSFRTQKRTLLFVFYGPSPETALSVAWEDALHQAIVETAKPAKPPKPEPAESPTPTPAD